ncbi:syntaxin-12-like [Ctenocephalides felis]|uniref:syntaxin-12-like n=1 Tax=Ctenocephalides felis TaxID=7515 RepID=UPI000E6E1DD9|nr:syntaxin-12-like [Ctenocephalides felis]
MLRGNNPGTHRSYGSVNNSEVSSSIEAMPSNTDVGFAGFSPTELYNLSENIITNIYTVNSSWRTLEKALNNIGTRKDNQSLREKIHTTQLSANQLISATSRDLQRLTQVVRRGNKQQKLQAERLTSDLREAVERYSLMQKKIAEKMKQHLKFPNQSVSSAEETIQNDIDDQARLLQAQRQIQNEQEFERDMLLEREARVKQIEADVLDVNQIMRELSALVHTQGEAIDTIEGSIENAAIDVEAGNSELRKAAQLQNKNRKKLLILIAIALLIGIIITVILVTKLKR